MVTNRNIIFSIILLISFSYFSTVMISCRKQSAATSNNTSKSNTVSDSESKRYWHINITIPMGSSIVEQEFWFDSKEGKLIRIKDMFNDVTGIKEVSDFGYNITSGDFKSTTVVLFDSKPPYIEYTFETTAKVEASLMDKKYQGTWGILEKSFKYE